MNMNSCRTGNTHLGNGIAVKLSSDWAKILDKNAQVDTFILDLKRLSILFPMYSLKASCLAMEWVEQH